PSASPPRSNSPRSDSSRNPRAPERVLLQTLCASEWKVVAGFRRQFGDSWAVRMLSRRRTQKARQLRFSYVLLLDRTRARLIPREEITSPTQSYSSFSSLTCVRTVSPSVSRL